MKRALFCLLMTLCLFASCALCDIRPLPMGKTPGMKPDERKYTDTSYADDSITVQLGQGVRKIAKGPAKGKTDYAYAHIVIKDASQLRAAKFGSTNLNQEEEYAYKLARRMNAVVAVNGDFFVKMNTSYTYRNGEKMRKGLDPKRADVLLIDTNADFHIVQSATLDSIGEYIKKTGITVMHSFNFGPALIADGIVTDAESMLKKTWEDKPITQSRLDLLAQRACVAQLGPLEYLIVTCEGPDNTDSVGMTIGEFAYLVSDVAKQLSPNGALCAYNLDGGTSASLIFHNKKFNAPGDKSRHVNDILYFATLCGAE